MPGALGYLPERTEQPYQSDEDAGHADANEDRTAHVGGLASETNVFDLQVEAVKKSTEGNVWADTSSSRSMLARVIEHAVDQLGAERILFGTDTPLYFAATQKSRIAYASISDEAKRMILHDNAAGLLGLR